MKTCDEFVTRCAKPDFPGVYTDVRVYRNWIIDIIGGEPQWIYMQ